MTDIPLATQLHGFVDDLERSMSFDMDHIDCDDIILCGVGGSAVSGDFALYCCNLESKVPISLVRYPDLPNWVGERTLAVVSSYSGNTRETLEMYRQARECGCRIVAVTSGGVLRDLAKEDGVDLVLLPQDMQPRHAIGYMIGYTLGVIRAGGGPDISDRIRSFIPRLREYRDSISARDGLAQELAHRLIDRTPIICSDPSMGAVAFRWKTQFNENAKYVAFHDDGPNSKIAALGSDGSIIDGSCTSIVLVGCDDDLSGDTSFLIDMAARLSASGADVITVDFGGSSTLENMFRATILGDYVSMHMANIRGIDPAEVRPVMQMKAKLSALFESRGQ